jgi:putative peptidoglycan lipid II flippase
LPNFGLLKKITLMSLAAFIDSTICITILKITNNLNSNIGEFLLLIFGSLTFFIIYFLLTKCFKVNNFRVFKNI